MFSQKFIFFKNVKTHIVCLTGALDFVIIRIEEGSLAIGVRTYWKRNAINRLIRNT